jgi:hypothetical protein
MLLVTVSQAVQAVVVIILLVVVQLLVQETRQAQHLHRAIVVETDFLLLEATIMVVEAVVQEQ